MIRHWRATAVLASISVITCLLFSCSIATAPATVEEGKEFSWANVSTVKEGMEAAEVRRLLGEPYTAKQLDGRVYWRFYYRVRQQDIVRVLGIFPHRNTFSHWEREVELLFKEGRVETVNAAERDLLRAAQD